MYNATAAVQGHKVIGFANANSVLVESPYATSY